MSRDPHRFRLPPRTSDGEQETGDRPLTGSGNGKTMTTLNDELRVTLDAQPIKTICGVGDCTWQHEGSAREGREAAERHRAAEHPERPIRTPGLGGARPRTKWGREEALEAGREFAARHGHPPSHSNLGPRNGLPPPTTLTALFGSPSDYVVELGFERPTKGTSYRTCKLCYPDRPPEPEITEPNETREPAPALPARLPDDLPTLTGPELEALADLLKALTAHASLGDRLDVVLYLARHMTTSSRG